MFKTADMGVHTALQYRDPPIPDHCHHIPATVTLLGPAELQVEPGVLRQLNGLSLELELNTTSHDLPAARDQVSDRDFKFIPGLPGPGPPKACESRNP